MENRLFLKELKRIGPTKRLRQIRLCRERLEKSSHSKNKADAINSLNEQENKIKDLAGPYFGHMDRVANNENMSSSEFRSSIDKLIRKHYKGNTTEIKT